ncbi:phosphoenolpyruvate carboxykinase [Roseovarius sp. A-2]|nr:phosphoenolpyruvate carboxykinase [Roseovarius sp. A-2]
MREQGLHILNQSLQAQGYPARSVRYNAGAAALLETALLKGEGRLSENATLVVNTGKYSGRSPKDKRIMSEPSTQAEIWWEGNRAMGPSKFGTLKADMLAYLENRDIEVQDLVCGADPVHAVNIRLIAAVTWHALFLRHILRRPSQAELQAYVPDFTIINLPGFLAGRERHGTLSETVVALSFGQKLVLITGTEYSGENKKSAFTILNHLYPSRGIRPMHCSAKTIRLSQQSEPDIWRAVHSFGTVLENVVTDNKSQTRLSAAIDGSLDAVAFKTDRVRGIEIPCNGPADARPYLDPYETWQAKPAFKQAKTKLRSRIEPKLLEMGLSFPLSKVWPVRRIEGERT